MLSWSGIQVQPGCVLPFLGGRKVILWHGFIISVLVSLSGFLMDMAMSLSSEKQPLFLFLGKKKKWTGLYKGLISAYSMWTIHLRICNFYSSEHCFFFFIIPLSSETFLFERSLSFSTTEFNLSLLSVGVNVEIWSEQEIKFLCITFACISSLADGTLFL